MKVYKSLRTRIQYSIYLWTQTRMRIWWNLRTDVDEIFGDPHLSGHYACSLGGPHHGFFLDLSFDFENNSSLTSLILIINLVQKRLNFNSNFSSEKISNSDLALIIRKIYNFYFSSKLITNSNYNPYHEL